MTGKQKVTRAGRKRFPLPKSAHPFITKMGKLQDEQNINDRELEYRSGVAQATISNLRRKTINPKIETLDKVFKALGYKITVAPYQPWEEK